MAQMMMLLLLLLQQTAVVLLTLQHHLLPAMAVDQLHQSSKNLHLSLVALCMCSLFVFGTFHCVDRMKYMLTVMLGSAYFVFM